MSDRKMSEKYHEALAYFRAVMLINPAMAIQIESDLIVANPLPKMPPVQGLSRDEAAKAVQNYSRDLSRWQERDNARREISKTVTPKKRTT